MARGRGRGKKSQPQALTKDADALQTTFQVQGYTHIPDAPGVTRAPMRQPSDDTSGPVATDGQRRTALPPPGPIAFEPDQAEPLARPSGIPEARARTGAAVTFAPTASTDGRGSSAPGATQPGGAAPPYGSSALPAQQPPTTPRRRAIPQSRTPRVPRTPRAGPHSIHRRPQQHHEHHHEVPGDPTAARTTHRGAVDVWTFFQQRGHQHHCIYCLQQKETDPNIKVASFKASTSTSGMRKHLRDHHTDAWIGACDRLKICITAKEAMKVVVNYRKRMGQEAILEQIGRPDLLPDGRIPFSDDAFLDAICRFIVADDQSINVIECPQLRAIFLLLREELKDSDIPHRSTVCNRIMQLFKEHLNELSTQMKNALGKISFTMDMWSDPNLAPFMAITAHWIETRLVETPNGPQYELVLRSDLIGFTRVPGHHSGEHLAAAFISVLDRFGIAQKIGWVTLDNASNNDTFMESLELEMLRRGIEFDKVSRRIRCFPHIINLACKAVLGAMTNMEYASNEAADFIPQGNIRDPIASARTLVRTIRASSIRRQYFAEVQKALQQRDLQLLRDVDTRWSSTLLMIERVLLLREAIEKFLSHSEFEELRRYQLQNSEWDLLEAYRQILSAYRNRTNPVPAYMLAMMINPAQKLSYYAVNMPEQIPLVRAMFVRELEKYWTPPTSTTDTDQSPPMQHDWTHDILGPPADIFTHGSRTLMQEVDAYILDSQFSSNSVRYWQENQYRYPTIFKLALDILPIQGSAVPCERVFSSAKETMTDRRNRIAAELMEALQMLKFSFRHGRHLDFTAGMNKDTELHELEESILVNDQRNGG